MGTGLTEAISGANALFQLNIASGFMKAGILLRNIDYLKQLETGDQRLTDSSHLCQYIPLLLGQERKSAKTELANAVAVLVIFNGSAHLGEELTIVARLISTGWKAEQRLLRLHILKKSIAVYLDRLRLLTAAMASLVFHRYKTWHSIWLDCYFLT